MILPPGRAQLEIIPCSTGSQGPTVGMLLAASFAESTASVAQAMMTSTLVRTKSGISGLIIAHAMRSTAPGAGRKVQEIGLRDDLASPRRAERQGSHMYLVAQRATRCAATSSRRTSSSRPRRNLALPPAALTFSS